MKWNWLADVLEWVIIVAIAIVALAIAGQVGR